MKNRSDKMAVKRVDAEIAKHAIVTTVDKTTVPRLSFSPVNPSTDKTEATAVSNGARISKETATVGDRNAGRARPLQ